MYDRRNVETLLVLQPIAVDTTSPDSAGMLVIANGLMVALLVRLDAEDHEKPGHWFMEFSCGRLQGVRAPPFPSLEGATKWLRQRLRP